MNESKHVPNTEKTENVMTDDINSAATVLLTNNDDDDVQPTSYHSTHIVQIDRGLGGYTEDTRTATSCADDNTNSRKRTLDDEAPNNITPLDTLKKKVAKRNKPNSIAARALAALESSSSDDDDPTAVPDPVDPTNPTDPTDPTGPVGPVVLPPPSLSRIYCKGLATGA